MMCWWHVRRQIYALKKLLHFDIKCFCNYENLFIGCVTNLSFEL